MNSIFKTQNHQKQLERLAAQRELYSFAKKLALFQLLSTVIIPVALAVISLFQVNLAIISAIYGVCIFIGDISLIEPAIKQKRIKAAKIQELFDCDVLELPKSPLKTVDDITVEEVLIHHDAHVKIKTNIEKIKNWYPKSIEVLPISLARIVCQRTNCWWDSRLREKYAIFLKYFGIGVFALIVIIGLLTNQALIELTLIASGLIPFFQFCIRQCNEHNEAASRLDELVRFANTLWTSALTRKDDEIDANSRRLQDEIFEHRSKSPLILDFYYKLFRDKNETLMNRTSEMLVQEALSSIDKKGN